MNPDCPNCRADGTDVIRYGSYLRREDARRIARFRCHACQRCFSGATLTARYRQKRRRINAPLRKLLGSNMSQRRAARLVGCSRTTVARRLRSLAEEARSRQQRLLERISVPLSCVQFDELITLEHTKMKPLAVAMLVDAERYTLLGVAVSRIPASGPLAARSRAKYGPRPDQSGAARRALLRQLAPCLAPDVRVITDEHADYAPMLRACLPGARHERHRSVRGRHGAQGELKRIGHDPLFCINHVFAMCRANVCRLIRRTWCTTKQAERLADHLAIFLDYYNEQLRPKNKGAAVV